MSGEKQQDLAIPFLATLCKSQSRNQKDLAMYRVLYDLFPTSGNNTAKHCILKDSLAGAVSTERPARCLVFTAYTVSYLAYVPCRCVDYITMGFTLASAWLILLESGVGPEVGTIGCGIS